MIVEPRSIDKSNRVHTMLQVIIKNINLMNILTDDEPTIAKESKENS